MKNRDRTGSTSTPGMSLKRFAELAEAYGGDFERWPEAERFAAIALAGRSGEARSLLADAHGLDYLLSRFGAPPAPSDALVERVSALERETGGTAEMPSPQVRIDVPAGATARRGLIPAARSNALMLSVLLNVVLAGALAGALGGVWIGSGPAPGMPSEVAYVQTDIEAALLDDGEAGLDEELGAPIPADTDFVEFDADSSDDFEIAGWPDEDRPSIDGISPI